MIQDKAQCAENGGAFSSTVTPYWIMRVVGTHNEEELLSFTARVEERCRELKCGTADSLTGAQRAFASRSLRVSRNAERGMMTISIELPMETGELLEKALDKARDDSTPSVEFVDASWSAGGETSLDNLMLLCSQHHKLVHEGGFAIERDYQHHWFFKRPDGRAVPACGYHTRDTLDDDVGDVSRQAGAAAACLLALAAASQTTFFEILNIRLTAESCGSRVRLGYGCK